MPAPALLVLGTTSDAGKTTVVAGLCRWLARQGLRVAPFKAQNMALNSTVAADGGEIARAQAMQAAACGVEPETAMNPILLKPSGPRHSQVVVMGKPLTDADARSYHKLKPKLMPIVLEALADLRSRYDVVICEGAGSPAEVNLREHDIANMGLARAADLPAILVADIDRGGVFAQIVGTLEVLDPADREHIKGFVINKFRGDPEVLRPGLEWLEQRTGRPVLGVLPYLEGLWLDAEDSLALPGADAVAGAVAAPAWGGAANEGAAAGEGAAPGEGAAAGSGADRAPALDIAVVRLRWISNFTDFDPLRFEPGVRLYYTRSPADIERADLVILPGTKATVGDLELLRRDGLADALVRRAHAGRPILGICGGYQMLGERIVDEVESQRGTVPGLGLLPVETVFERDKIVRRRRGHSPFFGGAPAEGYEIRHGRPRPSAIWAAGEPRNARLDPPAHRAASESADIRTAPATTTAPLPVFVSHDGEPDGCAVGAVVGTSWHGVLEGDEVRGVVLAWASARDGLGSSERFSSSQRSRSRRQFSARRDRQLDLLAEASAQAIDAVTVESLLRKQESCGA
ncbi:cobyric acid synthase [Thermoleophilum album]|uniref:cobyric acid synthase n=1 Tax=Thermoleophilum album TaxID=29539 RepID=UPI00237CCD0D|nr:cobyric acid synthase [Thermoleophilum album]WDT93142.1 cobyric acid synthase [Thermoleophilum album]